MFKKLIWLSIFLSLAAIGFTKQHAFQSSPAMQTVDTRHYTLKLEPLYAEGYKYYNRFRFTFTNKTDRDLIIDWSRSYYLQNDKRYGQFGWEGLTFEELKGLKEEPDIAIAAGKTETSEIFPAKLIGWREEGVRKKADTPEEGFTLGVLPAGNNGLSIAVVLDGKVLRKKVLVTISHE